MVEILTYLQYCPVQQFFLSAATILLDSLNQPHVSRLFGDNLDMDNVPFKPLYPADVILLCHLWIVIAMYLVLGFLLVPSRFMRFPTFLKKLVLIINTLILWFFVPHYLDVPELQGILSVTVGWQYLIGDGPLPSKFSVKITIPVLREHS